MLREMPVALLTDACVTATRIQAIDAALAILLEDGVLAVMRGSSDSFVHSTIEQFVA